MDVKSLLSNFIRPTRVRAGDSASRRARQKGFTMAEVLLSIIVFTISVVGVVAMQRASLAAENSASVLREGQRVGANVMEELQTRSFNELVEFDFYGNSNPAYPYDDLNDPRLFPYRGVPMDVDWSTAGPGEIPVGMRQNTYRVVRRVSALPENVAPGPGAAIEMQAIQMEVWVLWFDYQPTTPVPDNIGVDQLMPEMMDPTSADYRPYVQGIHLTTVRANDGTASEAAPLP